jgi:hypothetical protein
MQAELLKIVRRSAVPSDSLLETTHFRTKKPGKPAQTSKHEAKGLQNIE